MSTTGTQAERSRPGKTARAAAKANKQVPFNAFSSEYGMTG